MKYTILINQRLLAERFPELNLKDAALLAFLADVFASPNLQKKEIEGKTYSWAKYSWIATEMPLCQFGDADSVARRMRRLRAVDLIETVVIDGVKAMHRPGPRWDELSGIDHNQVGETLPLPTERPPYREAEASLQRGGVPPYREAPVYKGLDHEDQTTENNPPTPQGGGAASKISKTSAKAPKPSRAKSRDHESAHHYPEAWQEDVPFTNALADYFTQRREKRNPATPTAATLLRKKLLAAGIETATLALQTSATNGWTGVFPEKTTKPLNVKPGADEPDLDLW